MDRSLESELRETQTYLQKLSDNLPNVYRDIEMLTGDLEELRRERSPETASMMKIVSETIVAKKNLIDTVERWRVTRP